MLFTEAKRPTIRVEFLGPASHEDRMRLRTGRHRLAQQVSAGIAGGVRSFCSLGTEPRPNGLCITPEPGRAPSPGPQSR